MVKSKMFKTGDFVKILYPDYEGLCGYLRIQEESGRWLVQLAEIHLNQSNETILLSLEEYEFERLEAEIEEIE